MLFADRNPDWLGKINAKSKVGDIEKLGLFFFFLSFKKNLLGLSSTNFFFLELLKNRTEVTRTQAVRDKEFGRFVA